MGMKNLALDLQNAIAAVCPIDGVRVSEADKSTWDFFPSKAATVQQIKAAQVAMNAFDLEAWKALPEVDQPDLATQLLAYLAAKDPEVVAAVSTENLRAANATLTAAGQEAILAAVSQPMQPIGKLS
jgi:hypothetical protein